jgi:hypothetical protein
LEPFLLISLPTFWLVKVLYQLFCVRKEEKNPLFLLAEEEDGPFFLLPGCQCTVSGGLLPDALSETL